MTDPAARISEEVLRTEEERLGELLMRAIEDGEIILKNEWSLFRMEVQEEINRTALAGRHFVMGALAIVLCVQLASLFLASILFEVFGLPLWPSLGVVSVASFVLGVVFWKKGSLLMKKVKPIPDESIKDLSERVSWLVKNRT